MSGRYPVIKNENEPKVVNFPTQTSHEISDKEALSEARKLMPRGMSKDEQKVWKADIPSYIKLGRFKPHFTRFYREYCIVVARMDQFLNLLNQPDVGWKYVTTGRNGAQHKTRPEAAQYNDDWRKLNSLINQIGGSPATDQRFTNLKAGSGDDLY